MKALILNGSPRRGGVTAELVNHLAETMKSRGDEVAVERVYDLDVKPCMGCLKCRPEGPCVMGRDDAHRIAEAVDAADMLVLASPTYWGNITGPLKTLIDRMVTTFEYIDPEKPGIPRKMQKGKSGVIITCSNAPAGWHLLPTQSAGAVRSMKTVLKAGGFRVRKVVNVPDSSKFDGRLRKKVLTKMAHGMR